MPARSIGTGTLSFGMVSIPIRMYAAGESASAVSFNLLHAKCKSRLKQQYVCPKDNEIVPRDAMVKGYEFSKEQYVAFTEEELKAMAQEAQKAIEITEFVPASTVDPVYFDGAYYLGPDKGGEKAYRLLNEAMKQTGRSALAKWAARGKQYLVLIRPVAKGLVMQQLLYADEVRPFSEVPVDDAEVKDQSEAILAKLRFAVATSTTAEEALRVLPALRPDLVIAPEGDVSRLRDEGPANLRVMVMNRDMEESPEELIAEVLRSVRRR